MPTTANALAQPPSFYDNLKAGAVQGLREIGQTVSPYIAPVVDTLSKAPLASIVNHFIPALAALDKEYSSSEDPAVIAKANAVYDKQYGNTVGGVLGKTAAQMLATAPALAMTGAAGMAATRSAAGSMVTPSLQTAIRIGGTALTSVLANVTGAMLTGNDLEGAAKMGLAMPLVTGAGAKIASSAAANWHGAVKILSTIVPGFSAHELGLSEIEALSAMVGGYTAHDLVTKFTQPVINGATWVLKQLHNVQIPSGQVGQYGGALNVQDSQAGQIMQHPIDKTNALYNYAFGKATSGSVSQ